MQALRYILLIAFSFPVLLHAQLGGSRAFNYLQLPPSARVSALGGSLIPVQDDDVNQVVLNPGSLSPKMHNQLSFSNAFYFAGINFGYVGFAHHSDRWNTTLGGGIQYMAYGKFDRTDVSGNTMGSFKAADYALYLSAGRTYERIQYGASLKFLYSQYESYRSVGVAADIGMTYVDTTGRFMIGAVVRNIGYQLSPFYPDHRENLPFDIQFGIAQKLEHVPFRFSVVVHNLQSPDIRYSDPNNQPDNTFFGLDSTQTEKEKTYIADKIARHLIFGGEFLFGDNFRLRIGYNHLRRQELKVGDRAGLGGFSFGVGIRISKFKLDYSLARYHLAGASNQLTLTTNLQDFIPGLE